MDKATIVETSQRLKELPTDLDCRFLAETFRSCKRHQFAQAQSIPPHDNEEMSRLADTICDKLSGALHISALQLE